MAARAAGRRGAPRAGGLRRGRLARRCAGRLRARGGVGRWGAPLHMLPVGCIRVCSPGARRAGGLRARGGPGWWGAPSAHAACRVHQGLSLARRCAGRVRARGSPGRWETPSAHAARRVHQGLLPGAPPRWPPARSRWPWAVRKHALYMLPVGYSRVLPQPATRTACALAAALDSRNLRVQYHSCACFLRGRCNHDIACKDWTGAW